LILIYKLQGVFQTANTNMFDQASEKPKVFILENWECLAKVLGKNKCFE